MAVIAIAYAHPDVREHYSCLSLTESSGQTLLRAAITLTGSWVGGERSYWC